MAVRAKMTCEKKEAGQDEGTGSVVLWVVTDGSPENEEFFKYTPSGQMTLGILNPAAYAQFEEGKEYYIDISVVD